MAVEQIRPVEGQRKAAQRKTPELNVDTAITILFGTSRLEGDSFISTLRYARNEGMLEVSATYWLPLKRNDKCALAVLVASVVPAASLISTVPLAVPD